MKAKLYSDTQQQTASLSKAQLSYNVLPEYVLPPRVLLALDTVVNMPQMFVLVWFKQHNNRGCCSQL